jgi:SAM-dependent methyltransferase
MNAQQPCPLCGVPGDAILTRRDVPLQIGATWPTTETALAAPTGDLLLFRCPRCNLAWNATPAADLAEFAPGYDVSLHHSATYRTYLEHEARVLASHADLEGADVLEVGCGPGYFLRLLVERGVGRAIGFDPALAENSSVLVNGRVVELIAEAFRPGAVTGRFSAVVCRSVLELVDDPLGLLEDMRQAAEPTACPLYVEVPNAEWIFGAQRVWNLHFEHRWYFDVVAMRRCAETAGFAVLACEPCYDDGQYLRLIAAPRAASGGRADVGSGECDTGRPAESDLAAAFEWQVATWRTQLEGWRADGQTVAMWGAGGRGTSFLNAVCSAQNTGLVTCAVDINPERQGRHIPGTGHAVIAPAALGAVAPDVVIVSNPTYHAEIRSSLAALGIAADVVTL